MKKFKEYPQYVQTGISWIPEIPKGWKIGGLTKFLESIIDYRGKTPEKVDEGIFLVTAKNIKNGQINYDLSKEYVKKDDYEEIMHRGKPKIGDVLFTTEAPLGEVANVDREEIALAQRIIKFRGLSNILDNYYLKYWILSHPFQSNLKSFATGSTAEGIKASKLSSLQVVLPSIIEQKKIVKFLDRKIDEIDTLIKNKNRLIDLLNQQRQAIITEAVTKGLNPNVKMQDSGVEWIGEIPEHWNINKIKRIVEILTCGYASTPTYVDESEGVPFLSAQNVSKTGKLTLDKYNYISKELHATLTKYKKPRRGDILQVRVGAGIGQTCIVDVDFEFSIYVSLSHIRPKNFIHNRFLAYILGSKKFNEYASMQTLQAGGVGNLNVSDLEKAKIPYPSLEEQIEISNYLDSRCSQIDELVKMINNQINKLKEYRQSLIYEAVTGKIDVRDMKVD